LFNLTTDPFEQHDLSASEPEVLTRMMRELVAAMQSQHALYPIDDQGQAVEPQIP
jgi:hypothetical protein